jgi:hypothetical protein
MPDLAGRDEWERQFGRRLTRIERRWLNDLMERLGDPPNLSAVPESYWREVTNSLGAEIVPVLVDVYLASAQAMLDIVPAGVEWDLVHSSAAEWARRYGFELVTGITANTREFLAQSVDRFFSEQMTMSQLRELLEQKYGPVRADLIASTEVTRASVQGELEITGLLREQGIEMVAVWNTSNDEKVCPICQPLNQVQESPEGGFVPEGEVGPGIPAPPAHPRCRCWLNHELPEI